MVESNELGDSEGFLSVVGEAALRSVGVRGAGDTSVAAAKLPPPPHHRWAPSPAVPACARAPPCPELTERMRLPVAKKL
eukprot:125238-Rhodomonas_salina.1